MLEPFTLPFVQRGLVEVVALALAAGLLGTWIVLRGLAFYAHAVGTAAFPGLVAAAASVAALLGTAALGPRWLAHGFDAAAARAQGLRSPLPDAVLLALVALAAVAALRIAGALLATALIVVPA